MTAPKPTPEDLLLERNPALGSPLSAFAARLRSVINGSLVPTATAMGVDEVYYHAVLRGDVVTDWQFYVRLLAPLRVDPQRMASLRSVWQRAMTVAKHQNTSRFAPYPRSPLVVVPLAKDSGGAQRAAVRGTPVGAGRAHPARASFSIAAADAVEFNALVRKFQARSGKTKNQLAVEINTVSRSQVYSLLQDGRPVLPTKLKQVQAILSACRVTPEEMRLMTDLWVDLVDKPAVSRPAAAVVVAADAQAVIEPESQVIDAALIPEKGDNSENNDDLIIKFVNGSKQDGEALRKLGIAVMGGPLLVGAPVALVTLVTSIVPKEQRLGRALVSGGVLALAGLGVKRLWRKVSENAKAIDGRNATVIVV